VANGSSGKIAPMAKEALKTHADRQVNPDAAMALGWQ
jgi:hypothetical protein